MYQIVKGDCLPILKWMPSNSVDITITSPPYNMRTRIRNGKYTEREQSDADFSNKYTHFSDALPIDEFYRFHADVLEELTRVSKLVFYNIQIVTGSKEAFFQIIGDFRKSIKDIIIWDKGCGQPAMHPSVINKQTELILILQSPEEAGRAIKPSYFERGTMPDLWRIPRGKSKGGHGATFSQELVEKILIGWSKKGDTILDPFMGTGTTGKVSVRMDRNFVGIELIPEYFNIAKENIESNVPTLFL